MPTTVTIIIVIIIKIMFMAKETGRSLWARRNTFTHSYTRHYTSMSGQLFRALYMSFRAYEMETTWTKEPKQRLLENRGQSKQKKVVRHIRMKNNCHGLEQKQDMFQVIQLHLTSPSGSRLANIININNIQSNTTQLIIL
jgi:hypothetical protein